MYRIVMFILVTLMCNSSAYAKNKIVDAEKFILRSLKKEFGNTNVSFEKGFCKTRVCEIRKKPSKKSVTTFGGSKPVPIKYKIENLGVDNLRSNILLVEKTTEISEVPLGSNIHIFRNCGDQKANINETRSVSYVSGFNINRSTTISKTKQSSLNIGVGAFQKIGISSLSKTIGTTSVETQVSGVQKSGTTTNNSSFTVSKEIPPNSILYIDATQYGLAAKASFSGKVVLSGDVILSIKLGKKEFSKKWALEDLLNIESRSIGMSGDVALFEVAGLAIDQKHIVVEFKEEKRKCFDINKNEIIDYKYNVEKEKPVFGTLSSVIDNVASSLDNTVDVIEQNIQLIPQELAQQQVTFERVTPLVSGMNVQTAEAVGTVMVRMQSLGSVCSVFVNGFGNRIEVPATPFSWSNWETLTMHNNSVSSIVTFSSVCGGLPSPLLTEIKWLSSL